jgi:hypothetical protein
MTDAFTRAYRKHEAEQARVRLIVCEECGTRVQVIDGKYATHGIRHPEDSPTCEASGTEPD